MNSHGTFRILLKILVIFEPDKVAILIKRIFPVHCSRQPYACAISAQD